MKRKILQLGDPVLTTRSEEISDFGRAARVAEDLKDTLEDFRARRMFGRGISAPQIGESVRMTFLNVTGPLPMVNPRIVEKDGTFEYWDDCFSFPDLLVWVVRSERCVVEYLDLDGAPQRLSAEKDLAELLQHEIDHLDGVLAVQRAKDATSFCLRPEFERRGKRKFVR